MGVRGGGGCGGGGFGGLFFFRFWWRGFFRPSPPAGAEEGSGGETPQREEREGEVGETGRRNRVPQPATEPKAEAADSAPTDNEEFVFVRRDGTVFFAVAYAWERGTLRYITSQGLRRTVKQDALDLDATRQFKEQRGLNFGSPP